MANGSGWVAGAMGDLGATPSPVEARVDLLRVLSSMVCRASLFPSSPAVATCWSTRTSTACGRWRERVSDKCCSVHRGPPSACREPTKKTPAFCSSERRRTVGPVTAALGALPSRQGPAAHHARRRQHVAVAWPLLGHCRAERFGRGDACTAIRSAYSRGERSNSHACTSKA